jgi:hypothetical protein
MVLLLVAAWLLFFVPLALLPLLPRVEGTHAPEVGRLPQRQVIALNEGRQERAA